MKVVVTFDIDVDIIDCPKEVVDNLEDYRDKFLKWLFDKQNDHSYWLYENGKKNCCCYRSEAFVEWLNSNILTNSLIKARLLESSVMKWDKKLPSLSF